MERPLRAKTCLKQFCVINYLKPLNIQTIQKRRRKHRRQVTVTLAETAGKCLQQFDANRIEPKQRGLHVVLLCDWIKLCSLIVS